MAQVWAGACIELRLPRQRRTDCTRSVSRAALAHRARNKVAQAYLDVYECNARSRNFHERLGFRQFVNVWRRAVRDREPPAAAAQAE